MVSNGPDTSIRILYIKQQVEKCAYTAYLSTMMPARIAWATLRNLGLSSPRRFMLLIDRVNVNANQSRTCRTETRIRWHSHVIICILRWKKFNVFHPDYYV